MISLDELVGKRLMKSTSNEYEHKHWPKLIVGIDEAGRGPLAGPLVVAGVVLPVGYENEIIKK